MSVLCTFWKETLKMTVLHLDAVGTSWTTTEVDPRAVDHAWLQRAITLAFDFPTPKLDTRRADLWHVRCSGEGPQTTTAERLGCASTSTGENLNAWVGAEEMTRVGTGMAWCSCGASSRSALSCASTNSACEIFSDVMKTSFCCVVAGLRLIRLVRRIAGNGMKE